MVSKLTNIIHNYKYDYVLNSAMRFFCVHKYVKCNICQMNFIDQKHFLFVSNKYDEERKLLFDYCKPCKRSKSNFSNEYETNKLIFCISN